MRRSADLRVLSRREMLAFAGCVGLTAVISSCTDGALGGIATGPLGNTGSGDRPDAGSDAPEDAGHADARETGHDATQVSPDAAGPTCTGSETDVGAATTFVTGTPVYFSSGKFFVVRDAGGLFAVTAVCTHEGATCEAKSSYYYCPRHGAEFQFDGTIISGPVSRQLVHYAMCLLANGHVGVTTTTCAKAQRLAA